MYKPCEIYYNQSIYNEPSYLKLLLTHWRSVLLIYPLKTLKNLDRFSDVFRGGGGRDKQQRAVGLKLIFISYVFCDAYKICILVGGRQSKVGLWYHSVNLLIY